ncbi:MAG: hypothetical protein AB1782_01170 [Cyanobacteriota bacterium]
MVDEIKPISTGQAQNIQVNTEKKAKEEPDNYFEQSDKNKPDGKPKTPSEVVAALNKEVPDDAKDDKKAKGKPGGPKEKVDPDTVTTPLLQAALGGDETATNQLNALLAHRDPAMVLSAQKALNTINNSKGQNIN